MNENRDRIDGFHLATGLLALVSGPYLLTRGAPAGWTFLCMAAGIVLLGVQSIVIFDIRFDAATHRAVVMAVAAMALGAIAIVYLTRAANDLPSLFPGHDGDSEQFRVVPGVMSLTLAAVLLARAIADAHPRRVSD
jgi:hypothetical protein